MTTLKTLEIPSHVTGTLVEGDYILADLHLGRYFALDSVGSVVWSSIVEGRSVDEAIDRVSEEFNVSLVRARQDILDFLSQLQAQGLLRAVE